MVTNKETLARMIKETQEKFEKEGMEYIGKAPHGDAPDWIRVPKEFESKYSSGQWTKFEGDNNVYVLISLGGRHAHVYRQLKSEYYDTNSESGICPNCQAYVRRFEDDDFLTCHRCGWQHKPLSDRIRHALSL